jgi:hypothetical protein
MMDLVTRKCVHHWQREAVARCPECGRYFCRECVTEHEDRLLCASCLRIQTSALPEKIRPFAILVRAFQIVVSLIIAWAFFYYIGRALLLMPDEFHEGSLWQEQSS